MTISLTLVVQNVNERSRVVLSRKHDDGSIETITESLGWFVTTDAHIAYAVGPERPNLEPGDRIRLTMEKVG